jgi:glutamine cyclotransferase
VPCRKSVISFFSPSRKSFFDTHTTTTTGKLFISKTELDICDPLLFLPEILPAKKKKKKKKKKKIPRVQSQDPFTIPLYTDGIHYHNGELLLSGESKKKSSGDMQIRSKTLSTFAMSFWQSVGVLRFVSHLFIKMRKGERK